MLARLQLKRRGFGVERTELERQRRAGTRRGNRLPVQLKAIRLRLVPQDLLAYRLALAVVACTSIGAKERATASENVRPAATSAAVSL